MYGLVLREKCITDAISKTDVMDMFDMLDSDEAYPIELAAYSNESSAMGFITPNAAESINYDYEASGLHEYIASVLDDMEQENENCEYEFNGIKIWISR